MLDGLLNDEFDPSSLEKSQGLCKSSQELDPGSFAFLLGDNVIPYLEDVTDDLGFFEHGHLQEQNTESVENETVTEEERFRFHARHLVGELGQMASISATVAFECQPQEFLRLRSQRVI